MGYFSELRASWRPVLAATIGLGTGFSLVSSYLMSVQLRFMRDEFNWNLADLALVGSLSIVMSFIFPFVGRLADQLGVRRTVLIGMVALPIAYVGLSLTTGPLVQYMVLFVFQAMLAITTTATVYSRVAVQYVEKSRGLALAIVASGPALIGAIGAPALNYFSGAYGWRAGWLALAALTVLASILVQLLLPRERAGQAVAPKRKAREDYPEILRHKAFWILLVSMLLCNLPQVLALTQLAILMEANGATDVSMMLFAFAIGTLAGRFVAGVALDRLPPHRVAMIAMALPSLGLLLIASSWDGPWVLTFAVLCFGLSIGAEGDLVGFLVSRAFGVRIYSSVMGLMTMAISFSAASGAAILSMTLRATGNFNAFLVGSAVAVFAGALLFLLLPGTKKAEEPVPEVEVLG